MSGPVAGAGGPPLRKEHLPAGRRAAAWLVWWGVLMALWIILDYSLAFAELWVGAGVAALGAFLVELVLYQSGTGVRLRVRWAAHAVALPGQVIGDTVTVFAALGRQLFRGEQPAGGFAEIHIPSGGDTPEAVTRRVLLVAGMSIAPNTVVLGLDRDRDVMIVHRLVSRTHRAGRHRTRRGTR